MSEDVVVAPKKRGRPKGSKNVNVTVTPGDSIHFAEEGEARVARPSLNMSSLDYIIHGDFVILRLHSDQVEGGLEIILNRYVIQGVSQLPNGNASLITNVGGQQPLILITADPYSEVKQKVYGVY
jgi:hypothetical protein